MTLLPTHSKKDMIINSLNEENKELSNQLYSLRLAVLTFLNDERFDDNYVTDNERQLALSAGIVFNNGTWILKEGEK